MTFIKQSKIKQNNQGSVMLTVLIAFLFISVLIAIIMPLVVLNFRMKAVERHAKDEFYYAEKTLNDIYSGIGKECAQELGDAYSNVLADKYEYTDELFAYEKFSETYVSKLVEAFYKKEGVRVNLKEKFNKYVTESSKNRALVNNAVVNGSESSYIDVVFVKKNGTETHTPISTEYKEYKEIVIKDIYVSSVAGSEYKSSITTDIVIEIPEISFFEVNENELDYALVGCRGLKFEGNANIAGNVYGGVDKRSGSADYYLGGINVSKSTTGATVPEVTLTSNYVVSAADVTVNDGKLSIANGHSTNDNEIWLENTIVGKKKDTEDKPAELSISGDTYALNDLQVEGKTKTVEFTGNYYGYGDGDNAQLSPKEENFKPQESGNQYYDSTLRSKSASIIVNAAESNVDLKGLKNLIILGQAYIDHNSKYNLDNNNSRVDNPANSKLSMDETGLGVTMKASQELLLVPEEFLDKSNPMRISETSADFVVDNTGLLRWANKNFASSVKLKASAPTRTVKFKKGAGTYAYCYLQFDNTNDGDEEKYRRAYISSILNCDLNNEPSTKGDSPAAYAPTLQTIKKRIVSAADSQESSIMIDDASNVYSKTGGVVSYVYDKDKENSPFEVNDIKIVNNASDVAGYAGSVTNLARKYMDLSTFLDYGSDFSKAVHADDYADADYPFGRLWWINGIKADAGSGTKHVDMGGCRVIIQGDSTLNLGSYLNSNPMDSSLTDNGYLKLIVISTGDVVIDSNVKMEGFIFSNGKVTVRDGKTLEIKSDLSVVQKRISAEVSDIKSNMPSSPDNNQIDIAYKKGYIVRYLLKTDFNNSHKLNKYCNKSSSEIIGNRRYNIYTSETNDSSRVINTDYTSFVSFDRWRKTGAGGQ